jgi:hypothetical protein
MMTQRLDRGTAYFRIFTDGAVLGDVCLDLIAHAFVDRALAGNRCLASSFSATARLFQSATITAAIAAHLCRDLTLAQTASAQFGEVCGFVACLATTFGAQFLFGKTPASAAAIRARQLPALAFRQAPIARGA